MRNFIAAEVGAFELETGLLAVESEHKEYVLAESASKEGAMHDSHS